MTTNHLKQLQESCGIIEDIIWSDYEGFLNKFFPQANGFLDDIYFNSDIVRLRSTYGIKEISYSELQQWIESI